MTAGGRQSQSKKGATTNTKSDNGIADMDEDGDNRTRNAKAQRRHREKRKAHLKLLEESVQLLTAQLEDARRQIGNPGYRGPLSPGGKSLQDMAAENAYLRDENADLRRQMYRFTGTYSVHSMGGVGDDVKPDGYAPQYAQPQQPMASPREGSSRDGQHPPPRTVAYPPPPADAGEHLSRGSRSRVMSNSSTSQAPNASPYMTSNGSFPTDPRAHALNQPQQGLDRYPPLRYESHMYSSPANHSPTGPPQPPPHALPRPGMPYGVDMYGHRPEPEPSWGPEAGPPPFQGSVYPVTYGDGPAQDEWRHHDEAQH